MAEFLGPVFRFKTEIDISNLEAGQLIERLGDSLLGEVHMVPAPDLLKASYRVDAQLGGTRYCIRIGERTIGDKNLNVISIGCMLEEAEITGWLLTERYAGARKLAEMISGQKPVEETALKMSGRDQDNGLFELLISAPEHLRKDMSVWRQAAALAKQYSSLRKYYCALLSNEGFETGMTVEDLQERTRREEAAVVELEWKMSKIEKLYRGIKAAR